MTAPPMNGNGMNPPEVPGNIVNPPAQDTSQAISELIQAVIDMAQAASMTRDNAAEAKDFLQGALFAAQAMAILDPNKTQTGTPLDHEIKMAQLQQQGAINLENVKGTHALAKAKEDAKAKAAAPTPAKKVSVQRDQSGRASSYTVSGS